jgi:hypothetical protein
VWNSLEVTKILVTLLLAAVGGAFTVLTWWQGEQKKQLEDDRAQQIRGLEQQAESVRNAAQLRLVVWREASPVLNDIYVYYMYVGRFKQIKPSELIADKRRLDKLMYSSEPLFSPNYIKAYLDFIDAAFAPHVGWLHNPKLRTVAIRPHDREDSTIMFTNEDCRANIWEKYWALQKLAQNELDVYGVQPGSLPELPTGIPRPESTVACNAIHP